MMHARRFMRIKEVSLITSISKSTIYQMVREHRFPKSIPISHKVVAWDEREVLAWQNAQLRKREEKLERTD